MGIRVLVTLTSGNMTSAQWADAAAQEPRGYGSARMCKGCPLRKGGEWRAGAEAAVACATETEKALLHRWGCHESHRPCAGMRQVLKGGE